MLPKLTWKRATSPTAVERTACTWYITLLAPGGSVLSMHFFLPTSPRYSKGPAPLSWRQTWYIVLTALAGLSHFQLSVSQPTASMLKLKLYGLPGLGRRDFLRGSGIEAL